MRREQWNFPFIVQFRTCVSLLILKNRESLFPFPSLRASERLKGSLCAIFFRSPAFRIVVISLLAFLGVTGLRWGGYLENAELDAYDWSMRLPPTTIMLDPRFP
jgi:hypothetical protein